MALPPTRASGPYRPTRLGQWEVIAKIAGGGMSAVYLGRRVVPATDIPNVVALKIVRHDAAKDEQFVKMFLEEGKLIARLVHPNIVRTLEVGGNADQDYIAMELLLGKTFAAIHDALTTRGVRLNSELAAWTAARIADALHYAHELADEQGTPLALVHRDVNPANVFATFDGTVKLFDFGLAKVTAGESSGSKLLAGKLSYLSPEQIMQMPLDRRSDIFSLGTTLWELLTSKRLFRRDSDIETVRAVQLGPIPDPRTLAPEVPEELARIARTALERNRDRRYLSAAHLARELDAFVATRSSHAELSARLAQLVDTLFPGEQKRQSGWLKPAISSSASRSMNAVNPAPTRMTPSPGSITRVTPEEPRRASRELTSVRPSATPPSLPPLPPPMMPRSGMERRTSWPAPAQRTTPSAPAPPLYRSRPPPLRSPTSPPPSSSSRTDVQTVPPPPNGPRASTTARDSPPAARVPVLTPVAERDSPPSSIAATSGRPRPRRAPVPLPSRALRDSVAPKADNSRSIPPPPDSERTQVDVSSPPSRKGS